MDSMSSVAMVLARGVGDTACKGLSGKAPPERGTAFLGL